jgi:hypothetical protein
MREVASFKDVSRDRSFVYGGIRIEAVFISVFGAIRRTSAVVLEIEAAGPDKMKRRCSCSLSSLSATRIETPY